MWETVQGGARKVYLSHLLPDDVRQAILDKDEIDALITQQPQGSSNALALSRDQADKAMLKADLLRIYLRVIKSAPRGGKTRAREDFMLAYNSGISLPEIHSALGDLSWKTIEGWKATLKKHNGDTLHLADRRGHAKRGQISLNSVQTDILLRCALHPNKPRISEAIRMARAVMSANGIENGHSEATYRRWLNNWVETNYHIWTFSREGAKAWNDKCAYYIERDYSLINVGDILVADGHVLNFEIINPWTGKPKRMTLIVFLDMKSSIPLGWEIMPTEDTSAISSALRRAILMLGKMPQVVYLDNGKAFKSRFFAGCDFEQAGFAGLYERLGIKTIFAWPYHGQSKTVERFFGSFAELERWCPTYTGTSIEAKPPRMNRGERLHRLAYEKNNPALTMEQAHRAIAAWFDEYANRPQRGHLKGQAPNDLFIAERGPGVDPAELAYLMMSMEIRTINRNGISFQGRNYYHPELHGRRHPVVIRYDLQDKSALYVFEQSGEFICRADMVQGVHPAAFALGNEADREKLVQHIEMKKRQEKDAACLVRDMLETEVLPQHRRQMAAIGIAQESGRQIKPGEIKQLPVLDEAAIMAEVKERQQEQAAESAEQLRLRLESLNEMDRYEAVLEMEAQGMMIPKQWAAYTRYYEMTPEYEKHREYFEELRGKLALMYQSQLSVDSGQ
jgi:putative transposase